MDVHIVVKGDTLWKIARQYGISFEDLKRVNAHLANPDYIVPGMKIFLPAKRKEHTPSVKGPEKKPQQGKPAHSAPPAQPSKPPTHKKPETGMPSKPGKPMQPIPLPPLGETVKPQPTPPKPTPPKPAPPVSQPKPPEQKPPVQPVPMPPAAQVPPMAMPQFCPPMMPVPCGWMPIYDADCYPMVHHHQEMQPLPMPAPQMPPMPMPQEMKPTPPAQMGTKPPTIDTMESSDEFDWEESPIYPGMGTGTPPSYPTSGWEMMESPTMPQMESSHQMVNYPPEQVYMPQIISPEQQNPYGMMQPQFFPCQPCQPVYHHGCHHHGHYPQMMPVPMPMQQWQMQPPQWPMQQMQPQQWPMQQMPMNQQQYFNQPDNNDCGSC
ncbi:LysM peptidoglycan-binding domain-containing protein [Sporosarcina oncorhynchi]|uniref:LysM peptidoglycan-binding domain-containing protein n=1 Tax=Sporosarcina oncorhynchi TaxID=3056444 RepID=A0ABZ0L888_9BACL|nr:LysM peptidoglycan-binding domain-containing protein [Sporosarcina sp. T2O-4]WOV88748.1 LysM peptidoglycan-binding domain-containing protein [Sporosarcina sp. T2O-4]